MTQAGAAVVGTRVRPGFRAEAQTDVGAALARWQPLFAKGTGTLFQTERWLSDWYATMGAQDGVRPVLVTVTDALGRVLMGLPLVQRHQRGLRVIGFADLGVTDYAAPLLSADCPVDEASAAGMLEAVRKALPASDLLAIEKMPGTIGARPNPLVAAPRVRRSHLFGNVVRIGEDFDAWRHSREKTHRKELERSWRVFTRHPAAEFRIVDDAATAGRVMAALEEHQRRSIADKGWSYILDLPAYRAFYHRLLDNGLAGGEVVLSSLLAGDETVAALLGVRRGDTYAMIRIGNATGEWRNCSPGRLVIERTMAALHAQGVRNFDFTIGDYYYKKGFQPETVVLHDVQLPLSWKGFPRVWMADAKVAAKDFVKARPGLEGFVRKLLRRAPPPTRPAETAADVTPSGSSPSA